VRERLATRFGERHRFSAAHEESGFVVHLAMPFKIERRTSTVSDQTKAEVPSQTSLVPTITSNA
jgi:hypothetical protein